MFNLSGHADQNRQQFAADQAQQHETEPLMYNWRFPHDLWLAIAIDEEGEIALAIHPRDGILAGAFRREDADRISPAGLLDGPVADTPKRD